MTLAIVAIFISFRLLLLIRTDKLWSSRCIIRPFLIEHRTVQQALLRLPEYLTALSHQRIEQKLRVHNFVLILLFHVIVEAVAVPETAAVDAEQLPIQWQPKSPRLVVLLLFILKYAIDLIIIILTAVNLALEDPLEVLLNGPLLLSSPMSQAALPKLLVLLRLLLL